MEQVTGGTLPHGSLGEVVGALKQEVTSLRQEQQAWLRQLEQAGRKEAKIAEVEHSHALQKITLSQLSGLREELDRLRGACTDFRVPAPRPGARGGPGPRVPVALGPRTGPGPRVPGPAVPGPWPRAPGPLARGPGSRPRARALRGVCTDLRAKKVRLLADARGLEKTRRSLEDQQRVLREGDLAIALRRAEEAEARIAEAQAAKEWGRAKRLSRGCRAASSDLHIPPIPAPLFKKQSPQIGPTWVRTAPVPLSPCISTKSLPPATPPPPGRPGLRRAACPGVLLLSPQSP